MSTPMGSARQSTAPSRAPAATPRPSSHGSSSRSKRAATSRPASSPKTAEGYAGLIEHHIIPHLGSKLLQKLTTRDVEAWHSTLLTRGRKGRYGRPDGQAGLSARTIGHAHRILSKALREGMRHDLVLKNV